MNDKKTIKNILIGLFVAIALLVGYSLLAPQNTDSNQGGRLAGLSSLLDGSSMGQIEETDATVANSEILKILGNIQNISLEDDIFTNPVFRKLKDSRFIIPKPLIIGRPNPFLPIGYDIIVNTQDEQSALEEQAFLDSLDTSNDFFDTLDSLNL